ncbi:MAG TPA: acetylxylan esterase [Pirellulaceae bacterium]|nr:acetylxylan esterase [Pirellulaceae bacterium]
MRFEIQRRCHLLAAVFIVISMDFECSLGQDFVPNYDESKVPEFVLPELLEFNDGSRVESQAAWVQRREELLELFRREMFGTSPAGVRPQARIVEQSNDAFNGKANRKQVELAISHGEKQIKLNLLIYTPATASQFHPVFLGLNFKGNHSITSDPAVRISDSWVPNDPKLGIADNRSNEQARGVQASRWPIQKILDSGFGLVTCYYGDIDPDYDDGFFNGVHGLYSHAKNDVDGYSWGSIAAWAWGLSRIMDYLESDEEIMADRVVLTGHSRLGKAALWGGATDPRFAIVISNNSGCGGAALSRRAFGETVGRINQVFPHWFCERFRTFNQNEGSLPFDQHMLIGLLAPRPCYIASAIEDQWADPKGEFLAARAAGPAYELFGLEGIQADAMPEVDQPIGASIGYHIRSGGHDVTDYDWDQWIRFARQHFEN